MHLQVHWQRLIPFLLPVEICAAHTTWHPNFNLSPRESVYQGDKVQAGHDFDSTFLENFFLINPYGLVL